MTTKTLVTIFLGIHYRKTSHKIWGTHATRNVDDFLISCNKILDQYAPRKKKYVRGNHSPFMNKNLSKAIMVRTKPFLKNRTEENKVTNISVIQSLKLL